MPWKAPEGDVAASLRSPWASNQTSATSPAGREATTCCTLRQVGRAVAADRDDGALERAQFRLRGLADRDERREAMHPGLEGFTGLHRHVDDVRGRSGKVALDRLRPVDEPHRARRT